MKWWQWAFVALSLGFLFVPQTFGEDSSRASHQNEYQFPLSGFPATLDPAAAADVYSISVIQQIFDGLVQFDANLNVVPAIARSWQVSRDGLSYRFDLREGVRFHHGRPVEAEDFVYAFTRILDPEMKCNTASLFSRIEGAGEFREGKMSSVDGLKARGRHQLEIRLVEPYPPFLTILAMKSAKVVPREEVEGKGPRFGRFPVGTGPFECVEQHQESRIVLKANKDYFEGPPSLDGISYVVYPGVQSGQMIKDLREGRLENITVYRAEDGSDLQKQGYQLLKKSSLSLLFYGINCARKPLDDPRVRRALSLAIPRSAAVALMKRHVEARGLIPPGMPGYNPSQRPSDGDPAKAKTLLREAGYPDGEGMRPLRFWSYSQSDLAQRELAVLKESLEAVGIRVEIHFEPDWKSFEKVLEEGRFDLFRFAIYSDIPDPEDSVLALFPSDSPYNFFSYENSEFDRLMEQAKGEINVVRRAGLFRQMEQIILDDCPIVPILHYVYEGAFQPYVRGVELNALGSQYIPMKKVWLEK